MVFDDTAGSSGSTWLWVTFGFMALSAIGVMVTTFLTPMLDRAHGYCTLAILCIASTAYYIMAIDYGYSTLGEERDPTGSLRSVYWARYIDWALTTPLLLLDILLFTNLPLGKTLWIIAADLGMILLGLFAALCSVSHAKWGLYGVSCFLQLCIVNGLFAGYKTTHLRAPKIRIAYLGHAAYLAIMWLGYPIVWGLAEGSGTISVTAEIGAYAILDLLTKVVFGWSIVASVPLLSSAFAEEHRAGTYDSDVLGAPTYSPFSRTRHLEEHHALNGNKHPKATSAGGATRGGVTTAEQPAIV